MKRVLRRIAQDRKSRSGQWSSKVLANEVGLTIDEAVRTVHDLQALEYLGARSTVTDEFVVTHVTPKGVAWIMEHRPTLHLKRFARWGSAALAASASTFGLRAAMAEAVPGLSGLLAIVFGTLAGMAVAFGAHQIGE